MKLSQAERERIHDSKLKLQSVADSLRHVDPGKVPDMKAIEECLEDAGHNLKQALQANS